MRTFLLLLAFVCLQADGSDTRPQEAKARVDPWIDSIGERIASLLPAPIDGLAASMPWDVEADHPPVGGCYFGCTAFVQVLKERSFVVAEPALIATLEAAEKEALDHAMTMTTGVPSASAQARQKALEEQVETLKRSARRVEVFIHVNGSAAEARGVERIATAAGSIGGFPVHRFKFLDESYEPTPAGVRLAVALGGNRLSNPTVDSSKMATVVRTIVVSAAVTSRRETVEQDEVLIRKLLESIDYKELAKLLS